MQVFSKEIPWNIFLDSLSYTEGETLFGPKCVGWKMYFVLVHLSLKV